MIVSIVVGYALHDYKNTEMREIDKANENKVLPKINSNNVKKIKVTRAMGDLILVRTEDNWNLEQPLQEVGSFEAGENYLSGIADLKLNPVETSGPVNWSTYGLDKPEARFEIEYIENNSPKKLDLELGSVRTVDDGYYLRKDGRLFTSSADWTQLYLIVPDDLREKNIFVWDGRISSIEMKPAEINSAKTAKGWKLSYGSEKWVLNGSDKIVEEHVRDYMKAIRDMKADQILVPSKVKEKSLFTLILTTDKSTDPLKYEFVEAGTAIRVKPSSRSVIFEISKEKLASLHKDTAYFISKPENKNDKNL